MYIMTTAAVSNYKIITIYLNPHSSFTVLLRPITEQHLILVHSFLPDKPTEIFISVRAH